MLIEVLELLLNVYESNHNDKRIQILSNTLQAMEKN